ncbi:MAG: hypothetical protein KF901_10235 [Myxococcales bacterium]|nr:hypothetical protein [Myxococcales bacterium]
MLRRTIISLALSLALVVPLAAQEGSGGLEVTELVLSTALENGEPVSPTERFSRSDGTIFATVRLANPSREATSIRVAFVREGATSRGFELQVPARPRFRTVARGGTRATGSFRCVVYDAEGRELASKAYEVVE